MPYNYKAIEGPERNRWKDEQIDRRDAVGMVAQKRTPALRWWPRVAAHIPSDCRLSDLEAELEQLTVNVWGESDFARLISPISVRSSAEIFGLPTWLHDRQLQCARNPARCQRMIVSGLITAIAPRTEGNQ